MPSIDMVCTHPEFSKYNKGWTVCFSDSDEDCPVCWAVLTLTGFTTRVTWSTEHLEGYNVELGEGIELTVYLDGFTPEQLEKINGMLGVDDNR